MLREDKNHLGKNLKYLRRQRGLSQQVLANELGLSRSKIASYENGNAEPGIRVLVKFSHFFEIGLNQLLERDLEELKKGKRPDQTADGLALGKKAAFVEHGLWKEFETESLRYRKIKEGLAAFHELKKSTMRENPQLVHSLLADFDNLLSVLDGVLTSNEALVQYLKQVTLQPRD